jgi:hypothetical protein
MRILYENPSRDVKEQDFFERFINLSTDVPKTGWKKTESPDFLFDDPVHTIGLEVTSLVISRKAAIRGAQNDVLRIAADLARKDGLPPIEVQVQFRNDNQEIDTQRESQVLFTYVKRQLPAMTDHGSKNFFPQDLHAFQWIKICLGTVDGTQWLDDHRWRRVHMNWNRIDPIQDIQQLISKKEKLLDRYLAYCKECWLLIGVNEWNAPEAVHISQNTIEHVFQTRFTRVYFLRNVEERLFKLNVSA